MADNLITIKRYRAGSPGAWENVYPKTVLSQVINLLDTNGKINLSLLPNSVVGGTQNKGTITSTTTAKSLIEKILDVSLDFQTNNGDQFYIPDNEAEPTSVASGLIPNAAYTKARRGHYVIATDTITLTTNITGSNRIEMRDTLTEASTYYAIAILNGGEDATTLEAGDWLIYSSMTGSGTSANPYTLNFNVINNTYGDATSSSKGIVQFASTDEFTSSMTAVVPTAAQVVSFVAANRGIGAVSGTENQIAVNTSSGTATISLANFGTPTANNAYYTKVQVDAKGRVSAGGSATLDDIADGSTRSLANYAPKATPTFTGGMITITNSNSGDAIIEYTGAGEHTFTLPSNKGGTIYVAPNSNIGADGTPVYYSSSDHEFHAVTELDGTKVTAASFANKGAMTSSQFKQLAALATLDTEAHINAAGNYVDGAIFFCTD